MRLNGGRDSDVVAALLEISANSRGRVSADLKGGDDDDFVGLAAFFGDPSQPRQRPKLKLDGGRGFDHCALTDNVMAKGCEEIDDLAVLEVQEFLFPDANAGTEPTVPVVSTLEWTN